MTARDVLVGLLGESRADEVIERAARMWFASELECDPDEWDARNPIVAEFARDDAAAALAAVLPDLLASASEQAAEAAAQRDDLLAIIDDARHALWAPGAKVEPTRQVLARAAAAIADWQQQRLRARDVTPTATAVHLHSLLDQERAETQELIESMVPKTWDGLVALLDEVYPDDVFPTAIDDPSRDPGPRLLSLTRRLADTTTERDALAAQIGRVRALHRPTTVEATQGECAAEECAHEDACPTVPVGVCAECYRIGEDAYPWAYEGGGLQHVEYPCPTVRALDEDGGE